MSDAPELLPCPFCNSADLKVFDNSVLCKSCDATGPDLGHNVGDKARAEAIAAWNARAYIAQAKKIEAADKLAAAVNYITKQKLPVELETDYDADYADFEDGYVQCVNAARAALSAYEESKK